MARVLFPEPSRGILEKVTRAIETSQPWMPENTIGRVHGLSYRGPRKQGHDLFTVGKLGYFNGGPAGVKST